MATAPKDTFLSKQFDGPDLSKAEIELRKQRALYREYQCSETLLAIERYCSELPSQTKGELIQRLDSILCAGWKT